MKSKKKRNIFCFLGLLFLLCHISLSASAVVQFVQPIGTTLEFRQLILENKTEYTTQNITDLTVQTNGNWQYGNTRVFCNAYIKPNTSYNGSFRTVPIDPTIFEGYSMYKITINMWFYVSYTDGKPQIYQAAGDNLIYGVHLNNFATTSTAKVSTIEGNNEAWIKYEYNLTMDEPVKQIWFDFAFDTSDVVEQRQTVVSFFGNIQIDNLDNPQIGALESIIIGNPDVTRPPVIDQIFGDDEAINNQLESSFDDLRSDFIKVNDNFFAAFNSVIPAFSLTRYVLTTVMNEPPVTVLLYIVLTFGLVVFILRVRK